MEDGVAGFDFGVDFGVDFGADFGAGAGAGEEGVTGETAGFVAGCDFCAGEAAWMPVLPPIVEGTPR